MNAVTAIETKMIAARPLTDRTRDLLPILSQRADAADDDDAFVSENVALLKESGLTAAAVPVALGGSGATIEDLSATLRIIAQTCGSTGLAFSMHTHQVAIPAWRWTQQGTTASPC